MVTVDNPVTDGNPISLQSSKHSLSVPLTPTQHLIIFSILTGIP